jgi:hypothetical protein
MNTKILLALGVLGAAAWWLLGRKTDGKGSLINPFRSSGSGTRPDPFGFKAPTAGGFGLPAFRGTGGSAGTGDGGVRTAVDLAKAFGGVAEWISNRFPGSSVGHAGPNTPDIVEGPNGTVYRNTGSTYEPYTSFPVPRADEPAGDVGFDPGARNFDLGDDFRTPDYQAEVPDFTPDFGGGYAPETGFDSIDTAVAGGLA